MSDVRVLNEEYKDINEGLMPKKIKLTKPNLDEMLNESLKVRNEVKVETPVVEDIKEEIKVEETPVSFDIEEDVKEETEVKDFEPEEPTFSFAAYTAKKPEQVIDEEQEEQIKEKGDLYKGEPRTDFSKLLEDKPKIEEKKVTEVEFKEALKTESYSTQAKLYKEHTLQKYEDINGRLEKAKTQISDLKKAIKEAKDKGNSLVDKQNGLQKILNGINGLNLEFLSNNQDELVTGVFESLKNLFDKNKNDLEAITKEIKEIDEVTKGLEKHENASIEELDSITEEKSKYENENYPKLVKLNEMDSKLKEANTGLSEFTGIDEAEAKEEAPKTVVDVKSYDFGDTEMTFGGRAA